MILHKENFEKINWVTKSHQSVQARDKQAKYVQK